MTTVAEVIVKTLEAAGVERCYGIPGDTLNHITDAIRTSGIRWVHVRHEEAGGFAAGADAMLTGKLAACAGSCGPGSLHFINGLFESHRNRAPVVLIASQIVRDELGFDFPQEVDFKAVYASCSVFCEEIRTPAQARRMTAMAAQAALAKRGVAVLIVPADVSSAKAVDEPEFSVHHATPVVRPADAELDRLAAALNSGGRIAIYGGSGASRRTMPSSRWRAAARAVVRTSRAKDFLEHDNPFDVGMTGIFGSESGYHALVSCDVLLLLGCDFAWRSSIPRKPRSSRSISTAPTSAAGIRSISGVVGDIAPPSRPCCRGHPARRQCLSRRMPRTPPQGTSRTGQARHGRQGWRNPSAISDRDHFAPCRARRGVHRRRRLAHGLVAAPHCRNRPQPHGGEPDPWHDGQRHAAGTGGQGSLPDRQVIALSGDGGLAMLLGDLLTAVQEKLPIKVVVFNNGALDFVEIEQKVEGLLDAYTELVNPDFARVAEAIGFRGRRVEHAEDLDAAVQAWLQEPGPALLDVVTDRYELVMPPAVKPGQVAGMALYSAKAVLGGRGRDVVGIIRNLIA
jgi:pyruvate dehydrogenase (quinone)